MEPSCAEMPLFARYHKHIDANVAGRLKKSFPGARVESIVHADKLQLFAQLSSDLQGVQKLLMGILQKKIDCNYFIGIRIAGASFSTAAECAIENILAALETGDEDKQYLAEHCQVGASRWNLCLFPLKLYSPRALLAVQTAVEEADLQSIFDTQGGSASIVTFEGKLRALGSCKLAAFTSSDSKAQLFALGSRFRDMLASSEDFDAYCTTGESQLGKAINPHVSVLKITWPVGSKKAKAKAQEVAQRVKFTKLDPEIMQFASTKLELVEEGSNSNSGIGSSTEAQDAATVSAEFSSLDIFQIDGEHPPTSEGYYYTSRGSLSVA